MIRFTMLMTILSTCTIGMAVEKETNRPIVGAIRWDAWSGCDVTKQVEKTLGPKKYHHRLPWFAQITGDKVTIDGSPQRIMDKEIEYAATAGLDYWAFVMYEEDIGMSKGIKQYLKSKSSHKSKVRFCMLLHNNLTVSDDKWPAERDRAVNLLSDHNYQTVLNGRPLVYLFGTSITTGRFEEWLAAARKKGHNPYCVFMGWNSPADYKEAAPKGFDAVSAYACSSRDPKFAQLANKVETTYWKRAVKAKVPYIPLVSTGWNKEPRKDNPVSWEKKGRGYHKQKIFTSVAKPEEIASHLKNAITFVRKHPDVCKVNAIICYAWNEYDEGGWLAPTRGKDGKPDTGRLDALQKILKSR